MTQRETLRLTFEELDTDPRVRVKSCERLGTFFERGDNQRLFPRAPAHMSSNLHGTCGGRPPARSVIVDNTRLRDFASASFEILSCGDSDDRSRLACYALTEQRMARPGIRVVAGYRRCCDYRHQKTCPEARGESARKPMNGRGRSGMRHERRLERAQMRWLPTSSSRAGPKAREES